MTEVRLQSIGVKKFTQVTETPGVGATREQLSMLYTRYRFAAERCQGKDVLEVACGAGQGLGYLAHVARKVIGGDVDDDNLRFALEHYAGRPDVQLQKIDAHQLPFEDGSFDVIILYEAIYYLERPEKFLNECRRVLRRNGILLICTVNKEWRDFNPSPFSTRYFSARELTDLLKAHDFKVDLFGGFSIVGTSFKSRIISLIKRTAVALRLIPRTMRGKEFFKRIFLGELRPLPAEVTDGMAPYAPPRAISCDSSVAEYKVFYVIGHVL